MSKITEKLSTYFHKYLSTKVVFLIDLIASVLSSFCTIIVADWILTDATYAKLSVLYVASSFAVSFLLMWALRTYRIIIRHSTLRQLGRFVLVALFKSLILTVVVFILEKDIPLVILLGLGDFLITFAALVVIRVAMVASYEMLLMNSKGESKSENVLIYGIGERSIALATRFQSSEDYKMKGFVTPGKGGYSHIISELPVFYFSSLEQLDKMIQEKDIKCILFSSELDTRTEKDSLIKVALDRGIKILLAPSVEELKDGKANHNLRKIEIEDLLMRPEIQISIDKIKNNFHGKTVMVTGAAGSIGSELCRQLATFGIKKLVLFDNAETPMHELRLEIEEKFPELDFTPIIGDVRIVARLDYAFRKYRPQVVFHAAAYKHVPLMEENPCEAVLVNVVGSRNVADKCLEYDVEKMVMISTDKAVNPTNIMGCTKRLAEIYVQSLGLAIEQGTKDGKTQFVTTRFGNVLGSNGSVIPRFRKQIMAGGPITVTDPEITRFFMTIPEACRLVMEAATMKIQNRIVVFDMGESVKINDLATRMIRLAGFIPDKDIKIVYTGLRPGEKLYEEVLSNAENTVPTDHSRIRIAKTRKYDYDDAACIANELEVLSRAVQIPEMVMLMKKTVPEFISQNSKFEEFDTCHS